MYAERTVRNVYMICGDEKEVEVNASSFETMVSVTQRRRLRNRDWRHRMNLVSYGAGGE